MMPCVCSAFVIKRLVWWWGGSAEPSCCPWCTHPSLCVPLVTLETCQALNHSSIPAHFSESGSVRSASTSHCVVSHCGREQPSFLWVRRSFTGLFCFLHVLKGSVMRVRRRDATSAALCPWWFSLGWRGCAHLWKSVNTPCWGCLLLSVIIGYSLSFCVGVWAAGRCRLSWQRTGLTNR